MDTTPQCRRAIEFASQAALRSGHESLCSAHLIFGLLAVNRGVAGVLRTVGLTVEGVERYIQARAFDEETLSVRDGIAFGQSAWHALIRAEEEATKTGCRFLGTDHLLLSLSQEHGEAASDIFETAKVDRERVRRLVVERLSAPTPLDLSSFDDSV